MRISVMSRGFGAFLRRMIPVYCFDLDTFLNVHDASKPVHIEEKLLLSPRGDMGDFSANFLLDSPFGFASLLVIGESADGRKVVCNIPAGCMCDFLQWRRISCCLQEKKDEVVSVLSHASIDIMPAGQRIPVA